MAVAAEMWSKAFASFFTIS